MNSTPAFLRALAIASMASSDTRMPSQLLLALQREPTACSGTARLALRRSIISHCCISVTPIDARRSKLGAGIEGDGHMFDVYLNDRRNYLLVVAKGQPIAVHRHLGQWHKKKETVAVSDEIKRAVQRDGYYWRRLRRTREVSRGTTPSEPVPRLPKGTAPGHQSLSFGDRVFVCFQRHRAGRWHPNP